MTEVMVSLRNERLSYWHIDDRWLQGPVGVDDVDELCRFWAASDCGEDGEDDVCYDDCYNDSNAHGDGESESLWSKVSAAYSAVLPLSLMVFLAPQVL